MSAPRLTLLARVRIVFAPAPTAERTGGLPKLADLRSVRASCPLTVMGGGIGGGPMKPFSLRTLALVLTVVAGTTFFWVTPVSAQGPAETLSVTTTHKTGVGANITCTLTFTIITAYQNNANRVFASYTITNTAQCRNASFGQYLHWVTPAGGSGSVFNNFGGTNLVPAVSQAVYSPVAASISRAQFTEEQYNPTWTFDDCVSNCTMPLTLTADGVA